MDQDTLAMQRWADDGGFIPQVDSEPLDIVEIPTTVPNATVAAPLEIAS